MRRLQNILKKLEAHKAETLCLSFDTTFGTIIKSRYQNQRNNLAIFGPFLDIQEFFQNRGLNFETSDSDFRDLLEKVFHMVN